MHGPPSRSLQNKGEMIGNLLRRFSFRRRAPRKTLILHIGVPKTGTTAVQQFLWHSRERLLRAGVSYPDIGIDSGAHHLSSPYRPDFLVDAGFRFLDTSEWLMDAAQLPAETVVMSSEFFCIADPGQIATFCKDISPHFVVKVCAYLRRQDNLVMAGYNQQVKAGLECRRLVESFADWEWLLDLRRLLSGWEAEVGLGNMIVLPFETRQLLGGDVILDFCEKVLRIDVSDWDRGPSDRDPNPALCPSALEFKLLINRLAPDRRQSEMFAEAIQDYSSHVKSQAGERQQFHAVLSSADRRDIIRRFEPDNQYLARRYLGREDGRLFLDPLPEDDGPVELGADEGGLADVVAYLGQNFPEVWGRARDLAVGGLCATDEIVRRASAAILSAMGLR